MLVTGVVNQPVCCMHIKILLILFTFFWPALSLASLCEREVFGFNAQRKASEYLDRVHKYKDHFERRFGVQNQSIAELYPDVYRQLYELYLEYPSYLVIFTNGVPEGHTFNYYTQRIQRIRMIIAAGIYRIAKGTPPKSRQRKLLMDYAQRFAKKVPYLNGGDYNHQSRADFDRLHSTANNLIDSIWAEMRIALRAGKIVHSNKTIKQLIDDGFITNENGEFNEFLNYEIDHLWFRLSGNEKHAVVFSETKRRSWLLHLGTDQRTIKKYKQQFSAQLRIISRIAAQYRLPAEFHYFFVSGIKDLVAQDFLRDAEYFNKKIEDFDITYLAPVKVYIHGNIDKTTLD